jgi:hypothetical protein
MGMRRDKPSSAAVEAASKNPPVVGGGGGDGGGTCTLGCDRMTVPKHPFGKPATWAAGNQVDEPETQIIDSESSVPA